MRLVPVLTTYPLLAAALLLGLVVLVWLIRRGLHKFGKNIPVHETKHIPASATWGEYLKGQGLLLFLALLTGGLFAGGSSYFVRGGTATKGVQLIQFEKINPAEHPVYEEIDVGQYSNVTILAKAMVPENASATVAIYCDRNDVAGTLYEVKRLDSVSNTWSRWEQENPGKHLGLVISPPSAPGAISATELTIQAYLSPK